MLISTNTFKVDFILFIFWGKLDIETLLWEGKGFVLACEAVLIPSTIFKRHKYTLSKGQMHKEFKQSFSKWQIIRGEQMPMGSKG